MYEVRAAENKPRGVLDRIGMTVDGDAIQVPRVHDDVRKMPDCRWSE